MARIIWLQLLYLIDLGFTQSLTDVLKSRAEISVWYRLIQSQWKALDAMNNITFFAPSNQAMSNYFKAPQISGCASTDPSILESLVLYHTLEQEYDSFPGTSFFYTQLNDAKYAAGADTNATYIQTTIPPDNKDNNWFLNTTTLVSGLNSASNLLSPPIRFANGAIYIVDSVFQLPASTTTTLIVAGYTAFAGALHHGYLEDLANTKSVDLNVPTNEAFQEVGNIMQTLTPDDFRAVMLYHMLNDTLYTGSGYPEGIQPTLEGSNITNSNTTSWLTYTNNARINNSAYFFSSDANNIWVIDQVLNPKNQSAPPNSTAWPICISNILPRPDNLREAYLV